MRYVILGGSGFIGSVIDAVLSRSPESECISLSSQQCDLLNADDTRTRLPPLVRDSVVIFAAGRHRQRSDLFETMTDNLKMIQNLVDSFRQALPAKVIFLSSVEVYGIPKKMPINEQTSISPVTLYGIGKVAAELLLERFQQDTKIPLAILRLPGVYGPGDTSGGLIDRVIRAIKEGTEFRQFGNGHELRDYVHVEDVASVVAKLSQQQFDRLILNLATGTSHTVKEIIAHLFQIYGSCPLNIVPRDTPICQLEFDVSVLQKQLPEQNLTPLWEGLQRSSGSPILVKELNRSEAIFSTGDFCEATTNTLQTFKRRAKESPRGRFRLCLHTSVDDPIQEMIIVVARGTYFQPHRHPKGKPESYHLIEGEMTVLHFDDEGHVIRSIEMGPLNSGKTFVHRLNSTTWHTVIPRSEFVVYHEVTTGPFRKDRDVEYAIWAPCETEMEDNITAYLRGIAPVV